VSDNDRYIIQAISQKQIEVAANGVVTGLLLESGATSDFTVTADNFKVEGSTTNLQPFSISGDSVSFDGVVDFTNTNIAGGYAGSTTINGGLITTGTIDASLVNVTNLDAGNIDADNAWVGGWMKSSNYDWNGSLTSLPTGFGLFSKGTEPGSYGYNIVGGKFYGGEIIGARILLRNNGGNLVYPSFMSSMTSSKSAAIVDPNWPITNALGIIDMTFNLRPYDDTSEYYNKLDSAVFGESAYVGTTNSWHITDKYPSQIYGVDGDDYSYASMWTEVWVGSTKVHTSSRGVFSDMSNYVSHPSDSLFSFKSFLGFRRLSIANLNNGNGSIPLSGTGKLTFRICWTGYHSSDNFPVTLSAANPPGNIVYRSSGVNNATTKINVLNQAPLIV
jgi:hypothetical protein